MNKRELIEKINAIPWDEGLAVDTLKINRAGLIKLIDQFDEPKEVVVPQFVADLIEYAKKNDWDFDDIFQEIADSDGSSDIYRWYYSSSDNMDIFARAWLDGYEVEKEKQYEVKIIASDQYLVKVTDEGFLGFLQSRLRSKFTKKELENLGFFWVFDCPGIEIEEVQDDSKI